MAPSPSTFHRILTELDPEVLDHAVRGFVDAISIVRIGGRFPYMPQAHRHVAARQDDAMRQVTRRRFPD